MGHGIEGGRLQRRGAEDTFVKTSGEQYTASELIAGYRERIHQSVETFTRLNVALAGGRFFDRLAKCDSPTEQMALADSTLRNIPFLSKVLDFIPDDERALYITAFGLEVLDSQTTLH